MWTRASMPMHCTYMCTSTLGWLMARNRRCKRKASLASDIACRRFKPSRANLLELSNKNRSKSSLCGGTNTTNRDAW